MRGVPLRARNPSSRSTLGFFGAADDHRPADAVLEHLRAAQNQRTHEPLAKLGFGDQQSPHSVGGKDQRLDQLAGYGVTERRPAGELRQFAKEGPRAECVKVPAHAVGLVAVNVHLAAENDSEADANFANPRKCVPHREAADLPETPSTLDIRRIEMRENLVAARLEDRRVALSPMFKLLER